MDEPLPPPAQPDHLTGVLRHAGVLHAGRVRHVESSARTLIMSRILRLRLEYEGDAADAPASLILKLPHPARLGPNWTNGLNEVAFYRDVVPAMACAGVPRCFEASSDPATHTWHLLLEDLTDSHATPAPWPLPPSAEESARIVAARARFQAAWWGDARLGASIGTARCGAALDAYLGALAQRVAAFQDRFGDHLPAGRQAIFAGFLRAAPTLLGGMETSPLRTIVQGDAHVWNCFLPRDGGDDVRLFDWDGWRVDLGVTDIAHMMAVHWYPDRRRRLEPVLLDHYHTTLLAHGVQGYPRDALALDYRRAVLRQIMWPVWQALHDVPPVIWWNNLERVLLAVDDLDCRGLLA